MRISPTLCVYIGRQYLVAFVGIFAAFLLIILLADSIELLRRVAGKPHVSFGQVVEMAVLKLPFLGQRAFPFAALFAGMFVFWRMSRARELEVVRSAGVSAWQFLLPAILVALAFGIFHVTVFNPVASAFLARYEREAAILLERRVNTLALRQTGLWLREGGDEGQMVVHAVRVLQSDDRVNLETVTVFRYRGQDTFLGRIDAKRATLEDGYWRLFDAWLRESDAPDRFEAVYDLPTELTKGRIEDSFASPETISFWDLPEFIATLDSAGFSSAAHRLHYHVLLAAPLLMCAMVFIAATFSLRHTRRGGAVYLVAGALAAGLVLFIFSDIVFALGSVDRVPPALAGWTPSAVATLLGLTSLLFLEDG